MMKRAYQNLALIDLYLINLDRACVQGLKFSN